MNRRTLIFTGLGLLAALCLAAFVAPYASSAPDGLERIATDKGFVEKGEVQALWRHALMPNYVVRQLGDDPVSTAAAGLAGTLCAFVLGFILARLVRARNRSDSTRPDSDKGSQP